MIPILGIDLGTTNSSVSIVDRRSVPIILEDHGTGVIPSVVSFHPSGEVLVGKTARERRIVDPQNTVYSAKRLIGRTFTSAEVSDALSRLEYRVSKGEDDRPIVITRAGNFEIPAISAFVLDYARHVAKRATGSAEALAKAVVTVPANFNDAQRQATVHAGTIAGVEVVRVLNEPTAAALAYGHQRHLNGIVAVYDLGGGTFDVSILKVQGQSFEVLGTCGESYLGGDDFDARIVSDMAHSFVKQHRVELPREGQTAARVRMAAESLKIELSQRGAASINLENVTHGPGGQPLALSYSLSRIRFESMVADLVERTFPVCNEALSMAGVRPNQVSDVLLVGGTTKMPLLQMRASSFFGKAPRTDVNPDIAVALGAGLQAASIAVKRGSAQVPPPRPPTDDQETAIRPPPIPGGALGKMPLRPITVTPAPVTESARAGAIKQPRVAPPNARTLVPENLPTLDESSVEDTQRTNLERLSSTIVNVAEVTPHSLSVGTVGGFCQRLITRSTRLPARKEELFTTSKDSQAFVRLRIYQGESKKIHDNTLIGHLLLEGLIPRSRGETRIQVSFDIDENGMLRIRAVDEATGRSQEASLDILGASSEATVEKARVQFQSLTAPR